ncbi:CBN-LPD-6 protein [Caenorhabditis brenneri]|uniref:CBN-LPD-6 protein n=1 Tax=Caenorhabditis brenneri TaxID=135651 RepID=G0PKI7_CAEBE|nr:CBN-LPD-6 protein [Caenorhabditis brenneri]
MKLKKGKKQRKSGAHNRGNVDAQSQKDALYHQEKFVKKIQKQKFLENKEKELARQPHCLVIHRGDVGKYVKGLESDLRNLMEPNTAKNLKILKRNNIKDFIVNGAVLGVTNMMVLTSSDASLQLRMMRFSQGPTLSFKVKQYSLARHVVNCQKRPVATDKLFKSSPLVVMNGFGDGGQKHLSLVQTFIQNMFPSINVDTIQLGNLKRCLVVSYDEETDEIQMRHYAIRVVASGLNKSVKKLMQAEKTMGKNIPNLSTYKDISDYFLNPGQLSDSEFEGDQQEVELPQDISEGRGCGLGQKSNVRLHEIGPRLTLELVKIEEGIDEGEVLYHKHHSKTPDELIKLRAHMDKKKQMKKRREQESEQRVIRRLTQAKEQQDAEEAEEKAIRENAARRQAAATGQVEEVENQKEKDREIAMNRERELKRANEEWGTSGDSKRGRYEDEHGRGRSGGFTGRNEESGGYRGRSGSRGRDGEGRSFRGRGELGGGDRGSFRGRGGFGGGDRGGFRGRGGFGGSDRGGFRGRGGFGGGDRGGFIGRGGFGGGDRGGFRGRGGPRRSDGFRGRSNDRGGFRGARSSSGSRGRGNGGR